MIPSISRSRLRLSRPVKGRTGLVAVVATSALLAVTAAPAVAAEASVLGWGLPSKIGLGPEPNTAGFVTPTTLPAAAAATAAAEGVTSSLIVTPGGVLAAGYGDSLGLGAGVAESAAVPFTPVAGTAGATAVATGGTGNAGVSYPAFSLVLAADRTVLGFGWDKTGADGQVPGSTRTEVPTPIAGLSDVTAIAAGASDALALEGDGTVWNWGEREILGNAGAAAEPGTFTNTPVEVELPPGEKAIAI
ncbi:MAG TPA: hypothetical protein VGC05_11360, partial [Mycobacterium sp.]